MNLERGVAKPEKSHHFVLYVADAKLCDKNVF